MLSSKPLSTRTDGLASQPVRVHRGAALRSANFASFMPPGAGTIGNTGGGIVMGHPAAVQPGGAPAKDAKDTTQGAMGLSQTRAMATLAKVMENSATPLSTLASAGSAAAESLLPPQVNAAVGGQVSPADPLQRPSGLAGATTAIRVNSHRAKVRLKDQLAHVVKQVSNDTSLFKSPEHDAEGNDRIGLLAAQFESGKDGISAIGYDRHGGTSYGKYQLSSRAGTMKSFMDFLETEEPGWAKRLQQAGAANTGGKRGAMPQVWQQLAEESPQRFEALQDKFIRHSHFMPAVQAVAEKTGLSFEEMPDALQEVLFSTAVQHGPSSAARIMSNAVSHVGHTKLDPEKNTPEILTKTGEQLIRRVYALRSTQFGSSTVAVQKAVKNRLNEEMGMAIAMLKEPREA